MDLIFGVLAVYIAGQIAPMMTGLFSSVAQQTAHRQMAEAYRQQAMVARRMELAAKSTFRDYQPHPPAERDARPMR